MPYVTLLVTLVLIAVLGGGVTYMAERSLPGEPLWNFKSVVNEKIDSSLAKTDVERANVSIDGAKTRLTEARALASAGSLNTKTGADIASSFDEYVAQISEYIAALQLKGQYTDAANVAAAFQSMLTQEASTIASDSSKSSAAVQTSLAPILVKVRTTLYSASSISNATSEKATSK